MKERPILFNGDMVRAILDGRKTQTRRPVKPQPVPFGEDSPFTQETLKQHIGKPWMPVGGVFQDAWKKPFGTVGDRLWIRETWSLKDSGHEDSPNLVYRADHDCSRMVWTPSIHMPRWASRIDLEIIRVWVERVQDITEHDASREGVQLLKPEEQTYYGQFHRVWQSIYGTWDANPWVWAYEFRRIKP